MFCLNLPLLLHSNQYNNDMSSKKVICEMDVCYEVNDMVIAYPCTFHFVDNVALSYVKMQSQTDDAVLVISNKMSAKDFLHTMVEEYTGRKPSAINLAREDDFEIFADCIKNIYRTPLSFETMEGVESVLFYKKAKSGIQRCAPKHIITDLPIASANFMIFERNITGK